MTPLDRSAAAGGGVMMARIILPLAAMLGLACTLPVFAHAESYPARPIRVVVPFPAGGPLDVVARTVTDKLAVTLKQPFVIENKPGAGGNLGSEAVAKAAPDGYTLLAVLSTTLTVNPAIYRKMPFDPGKDLRLISILTRSSQLLVVHPSLPVHTVAEFVAYARNEPVSYAHAGPGSPGHLLMEMFRQQATFKAISVPYRGNAPLVIDLVGGQIKAGFVGSGGLFQHVREGKVRALAISTPQRSPLLPDVPTIAEAGYQNVKFDGFFLLAAPAGLPDEIAQLLERETTKILQTPDVQAKFRAIDIEPIAITGADAKTRLQQEAEIMAAVVKAADMRVD
jgi:tripartite-type tricarboxylate transporter receptor subunit TctC